MKTTLWEIYRSTEDGIQYLTAQGRWSDKRTAAHLAESEADARAFAAENGEDQSAEYCVFDGEE